MESEKIIVIGQNPKDINKKIDDRLNAIYDIEQKINIGALLTGCLFVLVSLI